MGVESVGSDVLLMERDVSFEDSLSGDSADRIRKQTSCDTIAVDAQSLGALETITLVTTRGPYDPLKVRVGNAAATETGTDLQFRYPLNERQSTEERQRVYAVGNSGQQPRVNGSRHKNASWRHRRPTAQTVGVLAI